MHLYDQQAMLEEKITGECRHIEVDISTNSTWK